MAEGEVMAKLIQRTPSERKVYIEGWNAALECAARIITEQRMPMVPSFGTALAIRGKKIEKVSDDLE